MDKAEYRIKLEQINSLAEAGDFKGAAAVVDTIDWRHVKSVRTLCMVGEIYEANKRYEDSKRILLYAYKRSSISKTVLYRLAEINIRLGDYDSAKRYYNEFEQLSPHDTSRFILKYKLLRAEGATLDDQIAVLKEYKEREYTERWAYELAKLYMKNGQTQKCVEECDEMILWFAEGKFVTRAMELKMQVRALSDSQKKKYEDRHNAAEKEKNEKEIQESSLTTEALISKAADYAVDDEELKHEETKKKMTSIDAIRKMEAAADETVSSALSGSRPNVTPGLRPVRDPMYHSHTSIDYEGLERTGRDRSAVNPPYQNEAIKAAEKAFKQIKSLVDEPTESAQIDAEADEVRDIETAAQSAAGIGAEMTETSERGVQSGTAAEAEAKSDAGVEAETLEAAEDKAQSKAGSEAEAEETAEAEGWNDAEAKTEATETADAEEVKAISGTEIEGEAVEAAEDKAQSKAGAEAEETAEAEGWNDAEAKTEAAETADAEEAATISGAEIEGEAVEAAEDKAQSDAEAKAETAETTADKAQSDTDAEAEISEADTGASETSGSDTEADAKTAEEADPEELPAARTPEEIARDAEEEAQKAIREMMASFLSEFETSGKEYHMVSEVLPEEEDGETAEEEESDDEKLRMLGRETDESLGLTRTQSFQEMLKKALEEGGNYEEARQIITGEEEIQSPEEAARRTVMEAKGLTYDPESGDAADTETDSDDSGDADRKMQPDEEEEGPDDSDTDTAGDPTDGADSDPVAESADESDEIEGDSEEDGADTETDGVSGDADSSPETEEEDESGAKPEGALDPETGEEAAVSGEAGEEIEKQPEIFERVEVLPRPFTEDEKTIFTYFCDIPGISEQVTLALADIHNNAGDKTSKSGNVLIMGRQVSGKTRLAEGLVRAVCLDLKIKTVKIAKVIGEDLNEKEPSDIVEQMAGGFLVIEGAGSLSDEFVEKLNLAMEKDTDSLVIILEDEKADLMEMIQRHPSFEKKFTSTIIVPVFTNDELVTFARTYAKEKGYKFDEMGTLALYTMIGENQKEDEPVVVGKVKKMVDKAIVRSKGTKLTARFRKTQVAEDGRILLKERDFRF